MFTFNDVQRVCRETRIITVLMVQYGEIVFAETEIRLWVPDESAAPAEPWIKMIAATCRNAFTAHKKIEPNGSLWTCITLPNTDATRNAAYATLRFGGRILGELMHSVPITDLHVHLARMSILRSAYIRIDYAELVMSVVLSSGLYSSSVSVDIESSTSEHVRAAFARSAAEMDLTPVLKQALHVYIDGPLEETVYTFVTRVFTRLDAERVDVRVDFSENVMFNARNEGWAPELQKA